MSMNKAELYIKSLELIKHPEGGWYVEVYRSKEIIRKEHLPERYTGDRTYSTSIYYLLKGGEFSAFHRIKSDELWHFYDGDAVRIHIIEKAGDYSAVRLGRNIEQGEVLQFTVPHSTWFAAEVEKQGSFALLGCTVSPGFDFEDFEIGKREELCRLYPLLKKTIIKLTNF